LSKLAILQNNNTNAKVTVNNIVESATMPHAITFQDYQPKKITRINLLTYNTPHLQDRDTRF